MPPKGYWRDLPIEIQKDFMGASFYLGGGKTGMARRIGWDEPCLTLTCSQLKNRLKDVIQTKPVHLLYENMQEYKRFQTIGNFQDQLINNTNKLEMLCQ